MNITAKSRYGLKIMMDLTEVVEGLAQRSDIAARQGIPLDYMDHVQSRLRDAGLIASTRGRSGGYRLARGADSVSMLEIFMAVEDSFQPVRCLEGEGGHGCQVEHLCSSRDAWSEISNAIGKSLSGIILADIVAKKQSAKSHEPVADPRSSPPRGEIQECRAPRRRALGAELS